MKITITPIKPIKPVNPLPISSQDILPMLFKILDIKSIVARKLKTPFILYPKPRPNFFVTLVLITAKAKSKPMTIIIDPNPLASSPQLIRPRVDMASAIILIEIASFIMSLELSLRKDQMLPPLIRSFKPLAAFFMFFANLFTLLVILLIFRRTLRMIRPPASFKPYL